MKLLSIRNLKTYFYTSLGIVKAVDGLNLDINKGEILGLVGESGSGKSVTALSIMRLIPDPPGKIIDGEIIFKGQNLLSKADEEMKKIRGQNIAMSFQDPMTYLNPVLNVSDQIAEAILLHQNMTKVEALDKAIETMGMVNIPDALHRFRSYPFEFSGGMRQRLLLAIALSCKPDLLIADEPTTALDVITQAKILELLRNLKRRIGSSILLITHDLGIIAQMADRVAIMYSGQIQEMANLTTIYDNPSHPYTIGLLNSIPSMVNKTRLISIKGEIPDPINPPKGCRFHPRCPYATKICLTEEPKYTKIDKGHYVKCHNWMRVENR